MVYYIAVLGGVAVAPRGCAGFFIGATILSAISFADDLRPLGVLLRMCMQFIAVWWMMYDLPLPSAIPWWAVAAAAVCAVGLINAWNFMDGINGLNGAYTALTLGSFLFIQHIIDIAIVPSALLVCGLLASAVFLYCNFRRSPLCFAGDVGSVTSAALVLYPLMMLISRTGSLIWLGLVAVYGVDVVLTLIRRITMGCNIFQAHRMHLYQRLANECGLGHLKVALVYVAVQAAVNIGLLLWPFNPYLYLGAVISLLSAGYFIVLKKSRAS